MGSVALLKRRLRWLLVEPMLGWITLALAAFSLYLLLCVRLEVCIRWWGMVLQLIGIWDRSSRSAEPGPEGTPQGAHPVAPRVDPGVDQAVAENRPVTGVHVERAVEADNVEHGGGP